MLQEPIGADRRRERWVQCGWINMWMDRWMKDWVTDEQIMNIG